jgi:acylphosphatase
MSEPVRIVRHVMFRGRVQGVGFRAFVEDMALLRGIAGWVRNRRDGAVEAVFAGPREVVADMIAACRKGPPSAHVETVEETETSLAALAQARRGELFSVLPTA